MASRPDRREGIGVSAKGLAALVDAAVTDLAKASPYGQVMVETAEAGGWSACSWEATGEDGRAGEGDTPIAAILAAARKLRQRGRDNG